MNLQASLSAMADQSWNAFIRSAKGNPWWTLGQCKADEVFMFETVGTREDGEETLAASLTQAQPDVRDVTAEEIQSVLSTCDVVLRAVAVTGMAKNAETGAITFASRRVVAVFGCKYFQASIPISGFHKNVLPFRLEATDELLTGLTESDDGEAETDEYVDADRVFFVSWITCDPAYFCVYNGLLSAVVASAYVCGFNTVAVEFNSGQQRQPYLLWFHGGFEYDHRLRYAAKSKPAKASQEYFHHQPNARIYGFVVYSRLQHLLTFAAPEMLRVREARPKSSNSAKDSAKAQ